MGENKIVDKIVACLQEKRYGHALGGFLLMLANTYLEIKVGKKKGR